MSLLAYSAYAIEFELRSRISTVCQLLSCEGFTHASSVSALPGSSVELEGIVTQLLAAAKFSAAPKRPLAVRVALVIVPSLWAGEESVTAEPDGSSKPQAPTS